MGKRQERMDVRKNWYCKRLPTHDTGSCRIYSKYLVKINGSKKYFPQRNTIFYICKYKNNIYTISQFFILIDMNSRSEIETEDLEDEDAGSKSPAMKDLLARAEQVWNQQHPDGRLKTTE